ncbi:MAG: peptide-methionine (S)-S-oxide reductase MsrA [Thermoleophilaceae bacterium]|jgi:peptide-methionine (S)-S-oxide reductase|nr:peptide-methionine (S)-S-oxide reductase MsrA [Thermoleophilaceae bacterium]
MNTQTNNGHGISTNGAEALATATFAAGCFWGVEALFDAVDGVESTRVGYTGGSTAEPTYKQVCRGRTGHAEAVEVVYDPARVSYEELLEVFWKGHNPTTRNRQGVDIGSQYRSAIFFHGPEQEAAAARSKERVAAELGGGSGLLRRVKPRTVVTEIAPAATFHEAEAYHQRYFERHGVACGL